MPDEDKPKMVALNVLHDQSTELKKILGNKNASRITGKGEVKYWVSNRGYNVEAEPIFSTEAISLNSLVIPIILMVLSPILGFFCGFILGFLVSN